MNKIKYDEVCSIILSFDRIFGEISRQNNMSSDAKVLAVKIFKEWKSSLELQNDNKDKNIIVLLNSFIEIYGS